MNVGRVDRPALRTDRLLLEPQSLVRFAEWFAMEKARDEVRHRDLSEDQAWLRLCARQGMWDAYGNGFYFVLDARDGQMLGEVGLQFRRRGLGPRFDDFPEAAWAISSTHHGKGFASEAMQEVIAASEQASIGRIVALVADTNLPSRRLAARLGFTTFGETELHGVSHHLLERLPSTSP